MYIATKMIHISYALQPCKGSGAVAGRSAFCKTGIDKREKLKRRCKDNWIGYMI